MTNVLLSIQVTPQAHRKLFEMAQAKGYRASAYAQMLFDAGFAARIGQERGEAPVDSELDEQVKLVFACAGHGSTAAIARIIGIPESRVVKILDGWRQTLAPNSSPKSKRTKS